MEGRLNLVIAEALKSDPDVLGFQEVCYNDQVAMTPYILKGLEAGGYHISFWRTFETHTSFLDKEQLLIITKQKVLSFEEKMLPSMPTFENGYIGIQFKTSGGNHPHTFCTSPNSQNSIQSS